MDRNLEKHPYRNSKLETGDLISYNYLNGLFDTYRADITYYGDGDGIIYKRPEHVEDLLYGAAAGEYD